MSPATLCLLTTPTILGASITETLRSQSDWHVFTVSPATGIESIQERLAKQHPDVTILDALSFDVMKLFEYLGPKGVADLGRCIILTTRKLPEERYFTYLRWGVAAFVHAGVSPEELVSTIRAAVDGYVLYSEDGYHQEELAKGPFIRVATLQELAKEQSLRVATLQAAIVLSPETTPSSMCPLSQQQLEILRLISRGCINKAIGRYLGISDQTVKNHITGILKKLNVADRTTATVLALREGWISFPEREHSFGEAVQFPAVA